MCCCKIWHGYSKVLNLDGYEVLPGASEVDSRAEVLESGAPQDAALEPVRFTQGLRARCSKADRSSARIEQVHRMLVHRCTARFLSRSLSPSRSRFSMPPKKGGKPKGNLQLLPLCSMLKCIGDECALSLRRLPPADDKGGDKADGELKVANSLKVRLSSFREAGEELTRSSSVTSFARSKVGRSRRWSSSRRGRALTRWQQSSQRIRLGLEELWGEWECAGAEGGS